MPSDPVPSAELSPAERTLAVLPDPLMLVQADSRVVFTNPAAQRLLAGQRAALRGEHLISIGQLDAVKLADLLRLACDAQAALAGLWFAADMRTGVLHVSRLSKLMAPQSAWPEDCLLLIAHLDQPRLSQEARIEALCRCGHLTNTERYVLLLLADGQPVAAAAQQLQVRISTLRTHIRHILDKTQAPNLMQLLRWLGSSAGLPQLA